MKFVAIKKESVLLFFYVAIIIAAIATLINRRSVETFSAPLAKKVIAIDSGHGGWDPGKIQEDNLEKDINLSIALKLQSYLEQGGSTVLLTRAQDEALGSKKREDLKQRVAIAHDSNADILISIHQNAFVDERAQGSHVFYFENGEDSKRLAQYIQDEMKEFSATGKDREASSNVTYYLLKKTKSPSVIVECGFLSNPSDLKNLKDSEYQDRIAWAIYKGVIKYFSEKDLV
jgi:N-acetylmuramoyl-L-alanine amidase